MPILELLQRLVLYKTSAYTSSKAHPIWALSEKNCADLFIVCCFPDTNVAGLENYIALKLDLRTVGVDRYYPQPANPSRWAYGTNVVSQTYCGKSE